MKLTKLYSKSMNRKQKYSVLVLMLFASSSISFFSTTLHAKALSMPTSGNDLLNLSGGANAEAYIVVNTKTGDVLMDKNADELWPPASLTKLVTALVVLDTKPSLTKKITMTAADQVMGFCANGGGCIKSASGVQFSMNDLFYAALLPSANNAAAALARSTGMTTKQFAAKMGAKAAALGAIGATFNEPTGMDPNNQITAAGYAKILAAAYANSYLKKVAQTQTYTVTSLNNKKYTQTVKNSDKLLSTSAITMIGAKTGYLDESKYNFASLLKYDNGPTLAVVVLGEPHLYMAFSDTELLAGLAGTAISITQPTASTVRASSVK
jgi:D-alanyl-D-alanine carboxypeptidase